MTLDRQSYWLYRCATFEGYPSYNFTFRLYEFIVSKNVAYIQLVE